MPPHSRETKKRPKIATAWNEIRFQTRKSRQKSKKTTTTTKRKRKREIRDAQYFRGQIEADAGVDVGVSFRELVDGDGDADHAGVAPK